MLILLEKRLGLGGGFRSFRGGEGRNDPCTAGIAFEIRGRHRIFHGDWSKDRNPAGKAVGLGRISFIPIWKSIAWSLGEISRLAGGLAGALGFGGPTRQGVHEGFSQ